MENDQALQLVARQIYNVPNHIEHSELDVEWAENYSDEDDREMFSLHNVPPGEGGERYGYLIQGKDKESQETYGHVYNCAGEYIQELDMMNINIAEIKR